MNYKSLLSSLNNFKVLNLLDDVTPDDAKKLLAKAHALRQVRRILKRGLDNDSKDISDEQILSGAITLNGESYSTEHIVSREYMLRHQVLTKDVTVPIAHIFNLFIESKHISAGDILKTHLPVLRARNVQLLDIRHTRLGERADAYFIGCKHLLIAHRSNDIYALLTLNGVIEREITGTDISRHLNSSPCLMFYSGVAVTTERVNGTRIQHIDTSAGEAADITLVNEVEQSLGESAEFVNERHWVNLMHMFDVQVQSSKPHYYVDLAQYRPPMSNYEPQTTLF